MKPIIAELGQYCNRTDGHNSSDWVKFSGIVVILNVVEPIMFGSANTNKLIYSSFVYVYGVTLSLKFK